MRVDTALVGQSGPEFVIPVVAAAVMIVCAAVVAWGSRRWPVIAVCGLGSVGSLGQIAVVRTAPASQFGFVLGVAGGWFWYVGWLAASRDGQAERGLAIGGLLWIASTVTLTISIAGTGWPVGWSLGLGALAGLAVSGLQHGEKRDWRLGCVLPAVAAFAVPAVVGRVFGTAVLFVLWLIWSVLAVLGWSLAGLAK